MSFGRSFVHSVTALFAILCDTPFFNARQREACCALLARGWPLEEGCKQDEGIKSKMRPKRQRQSKDYRDVGWGRRTSSLTSYD
jgi:hypothetical protein